MPGEEERQIYVGDEAFIYHTYLGLYSKSEPYRMPQVTLLQRELVCSATTFQQYLPRLFMGQSVVSLMFLACCMFCNMNILQSLSAKVTIWPAHPEMCSGPDCVDQSHLL